MRSVTLFDGRAIAVPRTTDRRGDVRPCHTRIQRAGVHPGSGSPPWLMQPDVFVRGIGVQAVALSAPSAAGFATVRFATAGAGSEDGAVAVGAGAVAGAAADVGAV